MTGPGGALQSGGCPATAGHWEREFVWHEPGPQAWLSQIDHIAVTMDYEEMLHSVLLYRAVFGMRSTPSVAVSDPGGLRKVR
ncbi:MAG: hypothetical protein R3E95_17145 [Thiolinea sp.]